MFGPGVDETAAIAGRPFAQFHLAREAQLRYLSLVYADPSHDNPIAAAFGWLQGALLGSIATTAAVVAVASVGFLMLTGRIDMRRAAHVVFGCFILFGASSIARGIMAGANASPVSRPQLSR